MYFSTKHPTAPTTQSRLTKPTNHSACHNQPTRLQDKKPHFCRKPPSNNLHCPYQPPAGPMWQQLRRGSSFCSQTITIRQPPHCFHHDVHATCPIWHRKLGPMRICRPACGDRPGKISAPACFLQTECRHRASNWHNIAWYAGSKLVGTGLARI